MLLVACGGNGGGGDGGVDARVPEGDYPCDIEPIVTEYCTDCHGNPMRYGATVRLDRWGDMHVPSRSQPDHMVYTVSRMRLDDTERPMPPRGMPDEAKAKLAAWLDMGAPARPAGEVCGGADGGTSDGGVADGGDGGTMGAGVGPDALPCTPRYTFRAHGDGPAGGYQVSPSEGNQYVCFAFRAPWADGEQATAWAPIVDDERVLHHWILYQTKQPQEEGATFPCPTLPADDAVFLMGWAPGGPNFVMPEDVGLDLGADTWLLLQMHYWNAPGYDDVDDRSGVAICTTETPRAQTAGVLTLGETRNLEVPPRSTDVEVIGDCPASAIDTVGRLAGVAEGEPVFHVLTSAPHMHEYGKRFRTEILHADGSRTTVVDVDPFVFDDQRLYRMATPVPIRRGDAVRVTCVYDNPTDTTVRFGERTEDEMCFDFPIVYPIDRIPEGVPRACLDEFLR